MYNKLTMTRSRIRILVVDDSAGKRSPNQNKREKRKKFTETDQQNLLTSQTPELFLC